MVGLGGRGDGGRLRLVRRTVGGGTDLAYEAVDTDLFPDGDLRTWLARNGPLGRRPALVLVAHLSRSLGDAHAAGVVHGDVAPRHVLLRSGADGLVPCLCAFTPDGADESVARGAATHTGTLLGSPSYMAPERHFGQDADARGDIYSLGCLFWATLTGHPPYGGTDFQVMNAHINGAVPQLGTGGPADERIDRILAHALTKDPEQRTATAGELRGALLGAIRLLDRPVA